MKYPKPLALKDAPALIEAVFPAQKVSFEAQSERKAVQGQTLTGLGSYWKGRKPLILARAVLLGSLLPQTGDAEKDLEIFEKLMAFDEQGLARRALVRNIIKPKEIAARIELCTPWDVFTFKRHDDLPEDDEILGLRCPFDADEAGIALRWKRSVTEDEKLDLIMRALSTFETYEEKARFCKRPEEVDQDWLYAPIWQDVNDHYAEWGVNANSFPELVEQLGLLRFGHRPRVGDSFSGGGSIPFEAARLGCDAYAADLNPVACMLSWAALNLIGAPEARRSRFESAQKAVTDAVDRELINLKVEHDDDGNRAKTYLYCLETRCPETGWLVPMLPSCVIFPKRGAIARLIPAPARKRFDIEVVSGVSAADLKAAEHGTVADGALVYELDGQVYRTPIKTLRGDYRGADGAPGNMLRHWEKLDFVPHEGDIFQERLYAIHWIDQDTLGKSRQITFFEGVTEADLDRERKVEKIVADNLAAWQADGLVPDMRIEPGAETNALIRTRGWTHWHHLFNPRQLLMLAKTIEAWRCSDAPELGWVTTAKMLNFNAKLCQWKSSQGPNHLFYNQALNTFYNYGVRSAAWLGSYGMEMTGPHAPDVSVTVQNHEARAVSDDCDYWITDPPYADAVHYHEITEFFIAWLRRNPPEAFRDWTWDSRRALAIKGSGEDFRVGMVAAYSAMAEHMSDNGMQCVMFTHQDTGVWSDMVGIFWAAGLQVVAAWYIATETTSELKKGGYVQGTVILMLRKRDEGERSGFKQRILPRVRIEVERQIANMMHLNDEVKDKLGEPVFNDADLQMAGFAAALKVLTAYTQIDGEDVTGFALRPRQAGEETVVAEIIQQAAEAANTLLVPDGLAQETWSRLTGVQRFYFRMMDMETTAASKLDNYQNFAKAFRVADYAKVMGSVTANSARLKRVSEFASRDLTDSTEIGPTWLGRLIISVQQLMNDTEPAVVVGQIQEDLPDFPEIRPLLIDMLEFLQLKAPEPEVCEQAEILVGRLRNLRVFNA